MSLTEAGHRLLVDARAMLTLADDATNRLREERAELRGHLRVFSTVEIGQTIVSRILARFLLEHRGLTAELVYSNRPVQMIEHGHDAGVVAGEITDENVVARTVASLERLVVASPAYLGSSPKVRTVDDLESHRWLALSQKQFGGPAGSVTLLGPRNAQRIHPISPILTGEGVAGLREALKEGLGLCVMPLWLIREDLDAGTLVNVLPEWRANPIPLSVIHLSQRSLSARVRSFIDFAATLLAAELQARAGSPPSPAKRAPRTR
jgi:DNA-binding transcriptional LysR family regulator